MNGAADKVQARQVLPSRPPGLNIRAMISMWRRALFLSLAVPLLAAAGCLLDRSGYGSAGVGEDGGSGGDASAAGGGGIGGNAGAAGAGGEEGGASPCGNGNLDPGEVCDDGNRDNADGCSSTCQYDASKSCPPQTMIPLLPAVEVTLSDTTFGAGNAITPACAGPNNWPEVVYQVLPAANGTIEVTVSGPFVKNLYIRDACPAVDLACSESSAEKSTTVRVPVLANKPYLVFVDGSVHDARTTFDLSLILYTCGDGLIDINEECDDGGALDNDGCSAECQVECGAGGFESPEHHCYRRFTNNLNWNDAHNACLALGPRWDLVAISSAVERNFIDDVVNLGSNSWIGGNDMAVEGVFAWTNGEPFIFDAWDGGEPNDFQGNEDCVEYADKVGSSNDRFNDEECSDQQDYLCELTPAGVD